MAIDKETKKTLKTIAGVVVGMGIIFNTGTYYFTKHKISEMKKDRGEYVERYCKGRIEADYNMPRFLRLLDGGDDAAREYLELQRIKDSK